MSNKRYSGPTRISLPTMIDFIKDSENQLGVRFNFSDKTITDVKTFETLGEFNKMVSGNNAGKMFISPLALVTIRSRTEENFDLIASDKMVKDALTVCYDDMAREFRLFQPVLPEWLIGGTK